MKGGGYHFKPPETTDDGVILRNSDADGERQGRSQDAATGGG